MTILNKRAAWILLVGDVAVFIVSLWIMLLLRYAENPDKYTFLEHLAPFSVLFLVWLLVFFIFGLYDKQSVVFKSRIPALLTQAQIVNILIATAFFYFIPWYGITPKGNLFLYLFVSLCLILLWRIYGYFALVPRSREKAILVGKGKEMAELANELKHNRHYNIDVVDVVDLDKAGLDSFGLDTLTASLVVVDLYNEKVQSALPRLYNLLFSRIRFIEMDAMYENIFDRVPLSLVKHNWFLENVSTSPKVVYDTLKRVMDILVSFVLGVISVIFYPFVFLAIKLDDGGKIFIVQDRVGKNGKLVKIFKFRSMARNEVDLSKGIENNKITRIGGFLRKSRIDELPQLWNVFMGDLSLIGPRPELPSGVRLYEQEIPFYGIRHLIKPGLSGWAQIYHTNHPHHGEAVQETREKLSYDLYYIKNRSFLLDLNIALKTIRELVSRKGK
jgi:exopolysaccharide biosynthesis polyprenyl glycosylphosphotransferase